MEREVPLLDDEPRGEELVEEVLPSLPLERELVGVRERDLDAFDADRFHDGILGGDGPRPAPSRFPEESADAGSSVDVASDARGDRIGEEQ